MNLKDAIPSFDGPEQAIGCDHPTQGVLAKTDHLRHVRMVLLLDGARGHRPNNEDYRFIVRQTLCEARWAI